MSFLLHCISPPVNTPGAEAPTLYPLAFQGITLHVLAPRVNTRGAKLWQQLPLPQINRIADKRKDCHHSAYIFENSSLPFESPDTTVDPSFVITLLIGIPFSDLNDLF